MSPILSATGSPTWSEDRELTTSHSRGGKASLADLTLSIRYMHGLFSTQEKTKTLRSSFFQRHGTKRNFIPTLISLGAARLPPLSPSPLLKSLRPLQGRHNCSRSIPLMQVMAFTHVCMRRLECVSHPLCHRFAHME